MKRLQKKSFAIVVTCICFFLFGCSDTEAILKENEKQGTKIQTKISSALLELEKSSDEVKRIQASQSLFNILAENQDISSLNHRNALEIMSYLKDDNDGVRYWIALSLSFFGAYADDIVPELLSSLDEKATEYSALSSSDAILITLKKIAPAWRKRTDATKRVLERWPRD